MNLNIHNDIARDRNVDPADVLDLKKALNRLGYYQPHPKIGMNDIIDREVLRGLKSFQIDHGLPATAALKPHDATLKALQSAIDNQEDEDDLYIWCTVQDDKVRPAHKALHGMVRSFADTPQAGEEKGCRCYAKLVSINQKLLTTINDANPKWTRFDLIAHFYMGQGRDLNLEEIGYLKAVYEKAKEVMFRKLEKQIVQQIQAQGAGKFEYHTEESYGFGDVQWAFGGGTIRTHTVGDVRADQDMLYFTGAVDYHYFDDFTDPRNIRQNKYRTSNRYAVDALTLKMTDFGGTAFIILGYWRTEIYASIPKLA
jgi:hypothetical protein